MRRLSVRHLAVLGICVALNYVGATLALFLRLPVYLDALGTVLGLLPAGTGVRSLHGDGQRSFELRRQRPLRAVLRAGSDSAGPPGRNSVPERLVEGDEISRRHSVSHPSRNSGEFPDNSVSLWRNYKAPGPPFWFSFCITEE